MRQTQGTGFEADRESARRQVRRIRFFYIHALIYGAVITMLVVINLTSGDLWRGNWWVIWPATTWGVVLAIHGILANSAADLFGRDWEERKIDELVRRNRGE